MAEGKKISARLAPILKRYNGDTALFGTQIRKALQIVKSALNGEGRKKDEQPRAPG